MIQVCAEVSVAGTDGSTYYKYRQEYLVQVQGGVLSKSIDGSTWYNSRQQILMPIHTGARCLVVAQGETT